MVKRRIKRKVVVPIRLDTELIREVDIIALKENKYRSELVREAVEEYVKRYNLLKNKE